MRSSILLYLFFASYAFAQQADFNNSTGDFHDKTGRLLHIENVRNLSSDGIIYVTVQPGGTESIAKIDYKEFSPAVVTWFPIAIAENTKMARDDVRKKPACTLKEVSADPIGFLGRPVVIAGEIKLSDFYKRGYKDAQSTHVAFEISDTTGHCHAYMPVKTAEILKKALQKHEPQTGKFLLTIDPARFDPKTPQILAELLEVIEPSSLKN